MATERIVITGASRGIGEATARRLARPGRHLVLLARTEADLARVCGEARREGAEVDYRRVDLSDRRQVEETADGIDRDFGPVDGLVLNAGTAMGRRFLAADPEGVDYEFEVNVFAPTLLLRHFLAPMVERDAGAVAVVGSLTASVPYPGNATYAGTKAALHAIVRSIRLELAETNVHLGLVAPGFTRTSLTSQLSSVLPSLPPEAVARAVEQCLEGRRSLVVPGLLNSIAMRLFAALPELTDALVARVPQLVPKPLQPDAESAEQPPPNRETSPWPRVS